MKNKNLKKKERRFREVRSRSRSRSRSCLAPCLKVPSFLLSSGFYFIIFTGFPAGTVQIRGHQQLQQKISNLSVPMASQMDITSHHFDRLKVPPRETSWLILWNRSPKKTPKRTRQVRTLPQVRLGFFKGWGVLVCFIFLFHFFVSFFTLFFLFLYRSSSIIIFYRFSSWKGNVFLVATVARTSLEHF